MENSNNDRLNKILYLLDEGYSTSEIANKLGYKRSDQVSQYLRRSGYRWDKNERKFTMETPDDKEIDQKKEEEVFKPQQVINDFKNGNDPKKVAKNNGFKDYLEMAAYMKTRGYTWNDDLDNYEFKNQEGKKLKKKEEFSSGSDECKYLSILELLAANEEQLRKLFDEVERQNSLPRYHVTGHTIAKTISISAKLNDLVTEYARERNLTHKEIFTISLIQFLRRYGYKSYVNTLFEN